MTRMLTAAGALALAAVMMSGAVRANPPYGEIVAPPARLVQVKPLQPAPWHYEWQYHYDRWSKYVPGWVPVFNSVQ